MHEINCISKLFLFITTVKLTLIHSKSTIETIPALPNNTIASNYTGLIFKSQFELDFEPYSCKWVTGSNRIITIYSRIFPCQNHSDWVFEVTCLIKNNTLYTTLVVEIPIDFTISYQNNLSLSIICDSLKTINATFPLLLKIQDCPLLSPPVLVQSKSRSFNSQGILACSNNGTLFYSNGTQLQNKTTICGATAQWSNTDGLECWKDCPLLSPPVLVQSKSRSFNSQGILACSNNETLFYSNGTQLQNKTTICGATAQWSNTDGLECWKAPTVSLSGDLVVLERARASFSCDYNYALPNGTQSAFYFNKHVVIVKKGEVFTTITSKSDNNIPVYCQAITPFTEVMNATGFSQIYFLTVWFRPYQNTTKTCLWQLQRRGSCEVIFYSNPPSFVKNLKKNGFDVIYDNLTSTEGTKQTITISTEKVNHNDSGNYSLILFSSIFSSNFTIYFEIEVISRPQDQRLKVDRAIIASCVIVGMILLVSVVTWFYCKRHQNHHCCNKSNRKNGSHSEVIYENQGCDTNKYDGIYLNENVKQTDKAAYQNFNNDKDYATISQSSKRDYENNFLQKQNTSLYETINPSNII